MHTSSRYAFLYLLILQCALGIPERTHCTQLLGFQIEGEGAQIDISLASDYIGKHLGLECCVLSGANVARDIAQEQFAEATIGYSNLESAYLYQQLFDTPYFRYFRASLGVLCIPYGLAQICDYNLELISLCLLLMCSMGFV